MLIYTISCVSEKKLQKIYTIIEQHIAEPMVMTIRVGEDKIRKAKDGGKGVNRTGDTKDEIVGSIRSTKSVQYATQKKCFIYGK